MMMELTLFHNIAIALGLGLLVGIQREWAKKSSIAGVRTYPLITIFGVVMAELAGPFSEWLVAAGLLSVAAFVMMGNWKETRREEYTPGITSEIASLLMYGVGVMLGVGLPAQAIVVAGLTAVMLHWKTQLHNFVERIGEKELTAGARFVLIALVILPLLPNRAFGPYGVLNPFEIWLMVVLIVGISLGAYIAYLVVGGRGGTVIAGLLGGMISSTATTVSYARISHRSTDQAGTAAIVVMLASTIVFVRVLLEIGLVAPQILHIMAPPLLIIMGWFVLITLGGFAVLRGRFSHSSVERGDPPTNLGTAIVFGILYALVLVAVAFATEHYGDRGLYFAAALSGLTDMDAITLSSAKMIKEGAIEPDTGWRMILTGAMANLFFKAGVVAALGNRQLLKYVTVLFSISLLGAVLVLIFWQG